MKQWFFGADTETDWTIGRPIVHRGEYNGQAYVDKGTILAFEPERLLVHTHWSSVSGVPDAARELPDGFLGPDRGGRPDQAHGNR